MSTQCSRDLFGYEVVEGRQVVAAFDGGEVTWAMVEFGDEAGGGVSSVMESPLEGYAMEEDTVVGFLAAHADRRDDFGRQRLVRNGHAPERTIQTGIGPIAVQRPRVRDRSADQNPRIRFTSAVLPAYLRRTKNVAELLPWLYLKGISTGQFEEALAVLLGPAAPGLSATTIRRLVAAWQDEHRRWQGRDLSARRYVCVWADGVYFTPRLEHDRPVAGCGVPQPTWACWS